MPAVYNDACFREVGFNSGPVNGGHVHDNHLGLPTQPKFPYAVPDRVGLVRLHELDYCFLFDVDEERPYFPLCTHVNAIDAKNPGRLWGIVLIQLIDVVIEEVPHGPLSESETGLQF